MLPCCCDEQPAGACCSPRVAAPAGRRRRVTAAAGTRGDRLAGVLGCGRFAATVSGDSTRPGGSSEPRRSKAARRGRLGGRRHDPKLPGAVWSADRRPGARQGGPAIRSWRGSMLGSAASGLPRPAARPGRPLAACPTPGTAPSPAIVLAPLESTSLGCRWGAGRQRPCKGRQIGGDWATQGAPARTTATLLWAAAAGMGLQTRGVLGRACCLA